MDALDEVVGKQSAKSLAAATNSLSTRYRGGKGPDAHPLIRGAADVYAYAAYRMPATYAAVRAVMQEIRARRPGWQPQELFDAGAGPGTGLWATCDIWPSLKGALLIERDGDMIDLGRELARRATAPGLRAAIWKQASIPGSTEGRTFDLVVAAYATGEFDPTEQADLVAWLWSVTRDSLVLVEPGTPRGFSVIREARAWLIAHSGRMIAPCPHANACPMIDTDWCHFSQRLSRSNAHRRAKQAGRGYEDEKYSYVVVSRQESSPIDGRVIRHPQVRRGHVYLQVCARGGLEQRIVTRKDKSSFRQAHDVHWGSALTDDHRA